MKDNWDVRVLFSFLRVVGRRGGGWIAGRNEGSLVGWRAWSSSTVGQMSESLA